jgi:hypothetical protein
MGASTLILFICCLLFSGFNFYMNLRPLAYRWLKLLTFVFGVGGLLAAFFLLVMLFVQYLK